MRRPFHVEAYPRLDVREVRGHLREGRDEVVWYDQGGQLVGMARLAWGGDRLSIAAQFRSAFYLPHGSFDEVIACTQISRTGEGDDVLTVCKHCERPCRKLVFGESCTWLCQYCQRLVHRVTIVSETVKKTERLSALQGKVGQGRPAQMRAAEFARLKEEAALLKLLLDERRAEAPSHQQWVLSSHWQPAAPQMVHHAAFEQAGRGEEGDEDGEGGEDRLELVGGLLFRDTDMKRGLQRSIRQAVEPAYRMLRPSYLRVSPLQVRRAVAASVGVSVPVLGIPGEITVTAAVRPDRFRAQLRVPFEGDGELFKARLSSATSDLFPVGRVEGAELVLGARFSGRAAAFVPALLFAELGLIRQVLEAQEREARALRAAFPQLLKQVVAAELPRVKRRRAKA